MLTSPRLVIALALVLTACPTTPDNLAPAFTITAPSDGSLATAGHGVELVGVVDDPDDVPEALRVTWSADGQPVCTDLVPQPDGRSICTWVAQLGGGAIEVLVTDPAGLTGGAAIAIQVQEPNHEPACSFDAPADGSIFQASSTITLQGAATDLDDDALQVVFTSSLDEELGVTEPDGAGAVELVVGPLSLGEHTLTMAVTDPSGASCSGQVDIEVILDDTGHIDPDTDVPDPDTAAPPSEG